MVLKAAGKTLYCVFCVVWFFALLCALAQPAQAYVDPGSGLLIWQVTGSVFTGVLFLLRKRARQFFKLFSKDRKKEISGTEPS
jgi:hypothetical protein